MSMVIVPARTPEDRESGGINESTCQHEWAVSKLAGYKYWCQRCLIPGVETQKAIRHG